jgi:hypothetical protein
LRGFVRCSKYEYTLGNPVKFIDNDGRETQLAIGNGTFENPAGHVALIIDGKVYSYGTNYTKQGVHKLDWGADAKIYLAAQEDKRSTTIATLKVLPDQEQKLKSYVEKNNPNAEGAAKYSVVLKSCVTVIQNALVDSGVLPVVANPRNDLEPINGATLSLTPAGVLADVQSAGLVSGEKTVGTPSLSLLGLLWIIFKPY